MDTKDEELMMEVPTDEDENVGDLPKKKHKKRKSKEERAADRKVVLWTLIFVLGITILFWLWPKMRNGFQWPNFEMNLPKGDSNVRKNDSGWKNYVEYKL